jgi:hypothetical protein
MKLTRKSRAKYKKYIKNICIPTKGWKGTHGPSSVKVTNSERSLRSKLTIVKDTHTSTSLRNFHTEMVIEVCTDAKI